MDMKTSSGLAECQISWFHPTSGTVYLVSDPGWRGGGCQLQDLFYLVLVIMTSLSGLASPALVQNSKRQQLQANERLVTGWRGTGSCSTWCRCCSCCALR